MSESPKGIHYKTNRRWAESEADKAFKKLYECEDCGEIMNVLDRDGGHAICSDCRY